MIFIVPKKIDTVTSFMDDLYRSKKKIDTVTSFMDDLYRSKKKIDTVTSFMDDLYRSKKDRYCNFIYGSSLSFQKR